MRENFKASLAAVLKHEGGFVDHPRDPGGATNMGITFATLKRWRGQPITKADVKALTRSEASEIYRKWYWDKVRGDDLPAGIDLVAFDGMVNSGNRGAKWVQRALGVPMDGNIGPLTIAAAKEADAAAIITAASAYRMEFLRELETWPAFGKGWTRRVTEVQTEALDMADAQIETLPTPQAGWFTRLLRAIFGRGK